MNFLMCLGSAVSRRFYLFGLMLVFRTFENWKGNFIWELSISSSSMLYQMDFPESYIHLTVPN